jgi:hypothetical protein
MQNINKEETQESQIWTKINLKLKLINQTKCFCTSHGELGGLQSGRKIIISYF